MRTLSGGNQQKVVLARWLLRDCRVLLLDEPTRGVDVGARSRDLRPDPASSPTSGVAVVVVSSDLEEVLGLADRVLVVVDGRVRARRTVRATSTSTGVLDLIMPRTDAMSENAASSASPTARRARTRRRDAWPGRAERRSAGMPRRLGRNLGLVIALVILCVVGIVTAGDRFASIDNLLTILRLASVIGVVAIGMTFVITGGGIDLSVGAIVALASVWATTTGTQALADDIALDRDGVRRAAWSARRAGLINGVLIAYGKIVAVHRDAGDAGGRARPRRDHRRPQDPDHQRTTGFTRLLQRRRRSASRSSSSSSRWSRVGGWVLLNRTTFGRRTFAVGGNPEAARLAGIKVQRHTVYLYALVGPVRGHRRRDAHGAHHHRLVDARHLYELDAIAAVVIGGTLLSGGRGTDRRHASSAS